MPENYPGNSRSQRDESGAKAPKMVVKDVAPERPKIEPLVSKPIVPQKKTLTRRFADNIKSINFRDVVHGVILEVLLPAAKDMIVDGAIQAVERSVYGSDQGGRSKLGRLAAKSGHTAYNRMSAPSNTSIRRDPREDPRRPQSRVARTSPADEVLPFDNRQEAEVVLSELMDLVGRYGSATVMDMKEMCSVPAYHTDAKWGWTDLRGSRIVRRRSVYYLELPDPEELP